MTRPQPLNILPPLSPQYDPWDPLRSMTRYGKHLLTSVEMTVSNMCNMRCEHCAVGETLVFSEGPKISVKKILQKLDEVEHLETISITGGEPSYQEQTVADYILPVLKYANERGIRSQINSNLTFDLSRYEKIAPYLDVMHISFNYVQADDFYQVGFAKSSRPIGREQAAKMYERMMENAAALSKGGLFVSAESMINTRTHLHLPQIHQLIAEMGCSRHEVHPMYPSSFAAGLPLLSLDELRAAIDRLIETRKRDLWMLFGTLPFFQCSEHEEDRQLLKRLSEAPNVTVRNDPDGRNRLNVNLFTGDVYVTDFSNVPPLGNIEHDKLNDVFEKWLDHPLNRTVDCYCPSAGCCGPNLLVKHTYYEHVDFQTKQAIL